MSFFEFWRSQKERGELLQRANQLRLHPLHLKRLLSDSAVRSELHNASMVSLLPPVGAEVFRRFTPASLEAVQRREAEEKERQKRKNKEVQEKDPPKQATHLEVEKPLPFIFGDPPPELLNTPLEELDPPYQSQKTFIVLSKRNILHRFNADSACCLLSPFNPMRTAAIRILIHSLFRLFILLTILSNCVFMMISYSPAFTIAEYAFTAVYMFEVIVKIVSRGFCIGRFTFLRDPWNWLDVMVISTAFLTPEFVDLGKVSVLRIIPRVLKMISLYPGVKTTAGSLVQSVRRLVGFIILAAFVLAVLALIGLHVFMGTLKHKCVIWPSNMTYSPRFDFDRYINNASEQYFLPGYLDALVCGNGSDAEQCPEGYTCLKTDMSPNYSFTNYDSFGWSLLSVFRLLMQDFWEDLVLLMTHAAGYYTTIIFSVLVFPSSFFLLSLIVALVARVTVEQDRAAVAKARQREEEFIQILEVMNRRKEEEEEEVSEKQPLAAVTKSHEEEHPAVGEVQEDQSSCPPCCLAFLKWNCCGCWRWLKQRLHTFVTNPFFDFGIFICLILNNVFMAMEHYPMTMEFENLLSITNLVFTGIYTAEALLKLVALDPYGYFKVGWHILDFIIVIVRLLDMIMADIEGLTVLHCFHVMLVLRLARWWPTFHTFIKIIWTAVWALRNLTLILLIMVFVFTVVGFQLFQKDYECSVCRIDSDCELPRWHMNGSFQTFLLIFRILCGEWIETMWDCMMVSDQNVCLIFFMTVVVVGNLLVLNLFLALLLSSVSGVNLAAPTEQGENNPLIAINQIKGCAARTRTWILEHLQGEKNHVDPDHKVVDSNKDNKKEYVGLTSMTSDQSVSEVVIDSKTPENEDREKKQQNEDNKNHRENTPEDCCCHSCYRCCPFLNVDMSRGTWRVWSNFRRACFSIVQHKYFETFIISIILLSSAALVFEDVHLQERTVLQMILDRADQVFTYVFLLEMLLKWFAYGFRKYFTSVWCWIDFLILAVSLMSLTVDMLGYSELEVGLILRTLRALRPLRALSRFQCLRVVLQALAVTLPALIDVLLVAMTVWLMFSIVGVRLFAGKFYHCYNVTSEQLLVPEEAGNKSDCFFLINEGFTEIVWKNSKLNFDNVGLSYLSLLHMATFSGWLEIIYAAVDSTQVEAQPVYEYRLYMYLYFVCFVIIGGFFTFNLFTRVFINTLDQLQHKFGGKHLFMTEEQQKLSRGMKRRLSGTTRKPVPRPQNKCRALLFDLVTKPAFEVFIVVVICLKMLTLMVETDEQSDEKDLILHYINFVFIIIFLVEFLLKIIALGRHYFSDYLNILDFVVIIVSIVGMFIYDFLQKYLISPSFFPVLRLARISRIIPVIPWLVAFVLSLPALFNICLLLFLLLFTYSIFGMFTFAYMRKENQLYFFESFGSSMMCLFTMTIATGWDSVLRPILNTPPDCDPYMQNPGSTVIGNCGSPTLGIIFFSSYIMLSALLVVHMYIAVVLETFNMDDTENLSDNELQMFYKTWRMFDTDGSQVIQYSQLSDFCDTLQGPLRIPKPNTIKLIHMDLPLLPGDKIHCTDILLAFTAEVFGDSGPRDALKPRIEAKFMTNKLPKLSYEPIGSTLQRKQEEVAAMVIQRAYRKHVLQDRSVEATAAEPAGGASGV
ncbi:sodium channel protein type 4 subunit alpha B-like isoform X2 [Seriola aureovittata]|uniref:sodium channel protein type 4 subunit alpha B-like isoform X2 n=1 Tax=Seriola aureovittata TaxID=2871759 RepID=UPI0024BF02C6|nr:sodium channel protein type 4 subunit alpha B-like isoform X2 [Seriola aureovittata]